MSEDARYIPEGNGTEVAMLKFLQENDFPVEELMTKRERESELECKIPFNPIRKRQTTVIRPYKGCKYVRIVVKGAPEYVFKMCTNALTPEGTEYPLDEIEKKRILNEDVIG